MTHSQLTPKGARPGAVCGCRRLRVSAPERFITAGDGWWPQVLSQGERLDAETSGLVTFPLPRTGCGCSFPGREEGGPAGGRTRSRLACEPQADPCTQMGKRSGLRLMFSLGDL